MEVELIDKQPRLTAGDIPAGGLFSLSGAEGVFLKTAVPGTNDLIYATEVDKGVLYKISARLIVTARYFKLVEVPFD